LHLAAALLLGRWIHIPVPFWTMYAGWSAVILSMIFALTGLGELIRAHTSPDPHAPTVRVVTKGMYRITRNPIYMGFLLFVIGLPMVFENIWGAFVSPLMIALFNRWIIEREEAYLEKKFGETYTNYKSRVRRWL